MCPNPPTSVDSGGKYAYSLSRDTPYLRKTDRPFYGLFHIISTPFLGNLSQLTPYPWAEIRGGGGETGRDVSPTIWKLVGDIISNVPPPPTIWGLYDYSLKWGPFFMWVLRPCFFFFCLSGEVGDVQWVPVLCVCKSDPKISTIAFSWLARLSRLAADDKKLCVVVPPPPPPMVMFGFLPMPLSREHYGDPYSLSFLFFSLGSGNIFQFQFIFIFLRWNYKWNNTGITKYTYMNTIANLDCTLYKHWT